MPLENLLNAFIQKSRVEKAFLFDVVSKIYIATDSNPVDEKGYELCSEMIDVVFDISCIYGCVVALLSVYPLRIIFCVKCIWLRNRSDSFPVSICREKDATDAYANDQASCSAIHLTGGPYNGMVLYLKEVSRWARVMLCCRVLTCLDTL